MPNESVPSIQSLADGCPCVMCGAQLGYVRQEVIQFQLLNITMTQVDELYDNFNIFVFDVLQVKKGVLMWIGL